MPETHRKPRIKRGVKGDSYSHRLKLEVALPQIIDQKLSAKGAAALAGVAEPTARQFLACKVEQFALSNKARFFQFAPRHAAAFNGAAERQILRLEQLNAKPLHEWTDADKREERHALACIKAIHPFLQLSASILPATLQPLKSNNDTGDSPTSESEEQEITHDDGL